MRKTFFTLFMLLLFSFGSFGQEWIGGAHFNMGIPTGNFKEANDGLTFPSISLQGLYQILKTPFYVGGEFGYSIYGTAMNRNNTIINGTDQRFRVRRNNNMAYFSGVVRIMPETSFWIRPFVEGQFGAVHTYTRSKVRENRLAEPLSSGTEFYDWAEIFQLGGGMMLALNKEKDTFLELRFHYLQTGNMDFLTKEGASYNELGQVSFSPQNAAFQLLQPSIALKIAF